MARLEIKFSKWNNKLQTDNELQVHLHKSCFLLGMVYNTNFVRPKKREETSLAYLVLPMFRPWSLEVAEAVGLELDWTIVDQLDEMEGQGVSYPQGAGAQGRKGHQVHPVTNISIKEFAIRNSVFKEYGIQ